MKSPDPPVSLPSPQAHLRGTLRLLDSLASLAAPPPHWPSVREFIASSPTPCIAAPHQGILRFDAYLTHRPQGMAFGVTASDRYEGGAFLPRWRSLVEGWGGGYDLAPAFNLREALTHQTMSVTASFGFDSPGSPPRVKLYFQEERWKEGVGSAGELRKILSPQSTHDLLPDWVSNDREVGVITAEIRPFSPLTVKVYLGGPTALDAARGSPPEVGFLARVLASASPLPGGWYYLTLRLAPGQPVRYAINKIYNPILTTFSGEPSGSGEAWQDVGSLFAAAGQSLPFARLKQVLTSLKGCRVVPTASALEEGGRSVDVYCGAWEGF